MALPPLPGSHAAPAACSPGGRSSFLAETQATDAGKTRKTVKNALILAGFSCLSTDREMENEKRGKAQGSSGNFRVIRSQRAFSRQDHRPKMPVAYHTPLLPRFMS